MKMLYVKDPYLSKSGKSVNFKIEDNFYSCTLELLNDFDVSSPEEFNDCIIELDVEKDIPQKGNWFFLKNINIVKIHNDQDKVEEKLLEIREEKKAQNKIYIDKMIEKQNDDENPEVVEIVDNIGKIDFENIYNEIELFNIKSSKKEITKIEKIIQKSCKITKTKYNNGAIAPLDYNFDLLNLFCDGDLIKFVEGELSEIEFKKPKAIQIPKSILSVNDNESITDWLHENKFMDFSNQSKIKSFLSEEISLKELIYHIESNINDKYLKIEKMIKKSDQIFRENGVYPLALAWPYVVGKTEKGTLIHAPIGYKKLIVTPYLHKYKIEAEGNFEINTYPILKNYTEKDGEINEIHPYANNLKDLLIEYYKHGIKIQKPIESKYKNYKKINERVDDLDYISKGEFFLSNELMFKVKPSDEYIYYDLKDIIKKYGDFSIPDSNITFEANDQNSDERKYILDVDSSKAYAIDTAVEKSTVIFGPPGTGKSETITAIIGDIINNAKTSIFVSEKSTAIEVIENNLKKHNLDSFVINLNKNSKDDFISKFKKQMKIIQSSKNNTTTHLDAENISLKWTGDSEPFTKFYTLIENLKDTKFNKVVAYKKYASILKSHNIIINSVVELKKEIAESSNKYDIWKSFSNLEGTISSAAKKIEILEIDNNNLDDKKEKELNLQNDNNSNLINEINIQFKNKSQEIEKKIEQSLITINNFDQVNKILKSIDEVRLISDKNGLDDVTSEISIKKPLFMKNHIKKNQKELKEIHKISSDIIKEVDDHNKYQIEFENNYENLQNQNSLKIKEIKNKYLELIEKNNNEIINQNGFIKNSKESKNIITSKDIEFLTDVTSARIGKYFLELTDQEYEICIFVIQNYDFLSNKNIIWSNHKTWKENFIKKIRKQVIDNYATKVSKRIDEDESLKNQLLNLNKYLNNKFKKRTASANILNVFSEAIDIFKIVFPCIMMNPDIAVKVLPNISNSFDYAIFDEASQMRLHRGIPILHRAKIAIVAGDDMQLGPTDLFTNIDRDDDNELNLDEDSTLSNDTVLNFAKDKYNGVHLLTHYRSKSKDLISFSNREFYENKISITDSPQSYFDGNPGIILEEIDGIWRENRINTEEAERCVTLIKNYHAKNLSVGVITFNDNQRDYIEGILNESEDGRKIVEDNDNFFIKSIKDVQGDEMDVIIFSITYGKRETSGKYVSFFGQFSKEKINVAITRSKLRMHILKSLPSSAVNRSNDHYALFKRWLEYIEGYKIKPNNFEDYENKFNSEFEEDYFNTIQQNLPANVIAMSNYQVGSKEIDVVLFDKSTNKFIGAIELDGKKYHSSLEQRTNDYHRQVFLENMGWYFTRTTPLQFYSNREKCVKQNLAFFNVIKIGAHNLS